MIINMCCTYNGFMDAETDIQVRYKKRIIKYIYFETNS